MPPAIIAGAIALGASAAAAAGYIAVSTALIISIAASVAGAMLTKTASAGSYKSSQERKQVVRAAAASRTVAYGRSYSSGVLTFAEEETGDQTKEWLHMVLTLCDGPIDGVESIYLGDDPISAYEGFVTYEVHSSRTTADPFLLANCPSWKDDMIGRGLTFLRISLKFDSEKFPSGLPNIKVLKRNKPLYDPRDGQTRWTNNAALVILDYYRNVLNVPDDEIIMDEFIDAANICDETVVNADGSTSARYTIDGEFEVSESPAQVLGDMFEACGGEPTYVGGYHGMLVGAYYGPSNGLVLDESCLSGDIKIVPETSWKERVNTIKGTFIDPNQNYSEADFPEVSVAEWITEDGRKVEQDFQFRFVTNAYVAQRLANIVVRRKRVGRSLECPVNFKGYGFRPGRFVTVNLDSLGIQGVEMRVIKWDFDPTGGINVTLRQETSSMYDDVVGQVFDIPDLTNLSPGGVAQPTNLAYTVEEIGEVVQGVLSWTNTGTVAYNKVVIRRDGVQVNSYQVPGTLIQLTGLTRDTYTAHVTAVNYMGATSPEGYLEFVIEAPDAPSSVSQSNGFFQFTLTPKLAQLTNVSTQFDFWYSGETPLANTDTATVEAGATRKYIGNQYTFEGSDVKNYHTYYFYIRTINAFGSSAFIEYAAMYEMDNSDLTDLIEEAVKNSDTYEQLALDAESNYEAIMENSLANDGDVQQKYKSLDYMGMKITASYTEVITLVTNELGSYAQKFEQIQATVDENSATVQTTATALATLEGKLDAQWGVKVQVNSDGTKYAAGIQLGVEGDGGTVQSYFLVTADNFGVFNPSNNTTTLAFYVSDGVTYMREAMIADAAITNAKIADTIQSSGYSGGTGWQISKSNNQMRFINGGVVRVKLGNLSV